MFATEMDSTLSLSPPAWQTMSDADADADADDDDRKSARVERGVLVGAQASSSGRKQAKAITASVRKPIRCILFCGGAMFFSRESNENVRNSHRETEKLEEFACFLVTGSNLKLTVENPEFIPDQRQKREDIIVTFSFRP
jgi:hypothetical protein